MQYYKEIHIRLRYTCYINYNHVKIVIISRYNIRNSYLATVNNSHFRLIIIYFCNFE